MNQPLLEQCEHLVGDPPTDFGFASNAPVTVLLCPALLVVRLKQVERSSAQARP